MPSTQLRVGLWVLCLVSLFYLTAVFPLAYFRHDDWLILGNAVHHFALDWKSAFHPTLFYVNEEVVWFFRPLFKALVYVFYRLLGFHYYLWLAVLYVFFVVSVALGCAGISKLTRSTYWGLFTFVLLLASLHAHFGSLFWMGEGMMNCPQLFLLSVNLYLFSLSREKHFYLNQALAYVCFVLALGIKESSVFHSAFIGLLVLLETDFAPKRKYGLLLLYGLSGAIYLYFRLFVVPVNPYYVPKTHVASFAKALFTLLAALALPLCIPGFLQWRRSRADWLAYKKAILSLWPYFLFVLVTLLPYLGHPFFSPGWLLLPSAYLVFSLGLLGNRIEELPIRWRSLVLLTLVLSAVPVGLRVVQLKWWDWKQGQMAMQSFIEAAPAEKIDKLVVYDCVDASTPQLAFDRVIGFEAGLHHLWGIYHGADIPIQIRECDRFREKYAGKKRDMILFWKFPKLDWVNQRSVLGY